MIEATRVVHIAAGVVEILAGAWLFMRPRATAYIAGAAAVGKTELR